MRQFGVDEISGDPTEHSEPTERTEAATLAEQVDVVVIGAGLAGLAAAAVAARAGCPTVVLDAHRGGGRAAVRRVPLAGIDGDALFNDGPRALYLGGPGAAVLDRLGVRAQGAKAPTRGSAAIVDGRIDRLPTGVGSMLRSRVVATSSKPTLVAAMAGLAAGRVRPGRPDEPTSMWIRRHSRCRDDVAAVLGALFRLATYTEDLDELSADASIAQVVHAVRHGVSYLDGGFQQLLDGLGHAAGSTAALHRHVEVTGVRPTRGGSWAVTCREGRSIRAESVVIAAGGPAVAANLLDLPELVERVGSPVTAACLELAVAGPVPIRFVLGVDEPVYLSEHAPPADLAPEGVRVVHVARYGATDAASDRARLEQLAAESGIDSRDVVARRFLRRMVVQTAMPSIHHGGLPGRPPVPAPGRPGVFLAGDWVGPVGMLADASLVSGEAAGALAVAAAATARARTRAGRTGRGRGGGDAGTVDPVVA